MKQDRNMRRHQSSRPLHNASDGKISSSSRDRGRVGRLLSTLDVFAQVDVDLQVKTETGAAVTISFWALMLILVFGEISAYLRISPAAEHLVVDTTMGQKMKINVDVTFHSVPCIDVHVDAMDVAGENQIDIDHAMTKQRLSPKGRRIGEPFVEVPGDYDASLSVPEDYCGSCYGATGRACCNTCQELMDAYKAMGWRSREIRRSSEQCVRDNHIESPIQDGEGCRLTGFMLVNKVAGNFHVAAGQGVMQNGRHVHHYKTEDAENFITSHTIHRLSFGEPYEGMASNPLDGIQRVVDEDIGTGLFQYFIKLIPTRHLVDTPGQRESLDDGLLTSQYTYTYKFRSLGGGDEYHRDKDVPLHHAVEGRGKTEDGAAAASTTMILPGVFFVYDLSPFMIEVSPPRRDPISHLLIRLCAVAGGAFAVSGIVDSAIVYVTRRMKRHGLLG